MVFLIHCLFFFKQKTAYDMRISDWSSDVCSSDLKTTAAPPSCRTSLRFPECHCRLKLLRRRRFPIKLVKAQDPARKLSLRPQIIWVDGLPMGQDMAEHSGHRARLRKRLLDGGGAALLDHELLEYLLEIGRAHV